MDDIGIKGIGKVIQDVSSKGVDKVSGEKDSFADVLKGSIEKVNGLQAEADQATQQFLVGNDSNIHQVMIAMEKANLSFQMMMQVRNKIVNAYEEMMRMQI
ncbi:MAG: flagellar hook-basal body complex protein FliE [Nitrospira sp.]|nr:flagellar hook-basal body complex protein FliE [Nitrospira sp.]